MCGILGTSSNLESEKNLFPSEELFRKSLSLIDHRGPDGKGIFYDNKSSVSLGHTRLSILDLSKRSNQPMISKDGDTVLIFNGEIYNYLVLKSRLLNQGVNFETTSDTEVILNLYLKEGIEILKDLDGIFSLSIWDRKKNILYVARDTLGVKPLYFFEKKDFFCFSSELKSLLPLLNSEDLNIDIESLNRYLTYLYCPGEGTSFKNIKKVNPGEVLAIENGEIRSRESFKKIPVFKNLPKYSHNSKKIIKELDTKLRNSVHKQMISDVQVGAFLSGGLDSSSVVAFAKEKNKDLKCFTIDVGEVNTDGLTNDLPYAEKVARHLDVDLQIVKTNSETLIKGLTNMVMHLDEPISDSAPLNVYLISKLARNQNMKVLLSGAGGDDIFTGYRRHLALKIDNYLDKFPDSFLKFLKKKTGSLDSRNLFFSRLEKIFNNSLVKGNNRIINYFKWIQPNDLLPLFKPSLKEDLLKAPADEPMINFIDSLPPGISSLDKMLALEQRFFLGDHNLIYTDKMSMATGVEVRVPLLDEDLMEFVYSIPDKFKQNGRAGKWIFKKTMEKYLPKNIIYRPKTGFGVPLKKWLNEELKDLLDDLLSKESICKRDIFEYKNVEELIKKNNSGELNASYTIFSLMIIEIWFRIFVDKNSLESF